MFALRSSLAYDFEQPLFRPPLKLLSIKKDKGRGEAERLRSSSKLTFLTQN